MQDSPRKGQRTTVWTTSYSTLLKEQRFKKQSNIYINEKVNFIRIGSCIILIQNATKVRNSPHLFKSTIQGGIEQETFNFVLEQIMKISRITYDMDFPLTGVKIENVCF